MSPNLRSLRRHSVPVRNWIALSCVLFVGLFGSSAPVGGTTPPKQRPPSVVQEPVPDAGPTQPPPGRPPRGAPPGAHDHAGTEPPEPGEGASGSRIPPRLVKPKPGPAATPSDAPETSPPPAAGRPSTGSNGSPQRKPPGGYGHLPAPAAASSSARPPAGGPEGVPLSHDQITRLIGMQKGARPDPKSYLPAEYIEKHLAKFTDGVSRIKAGPPQGTDGPPGGAYVMPKAVVAKMIDLAGGDVAFLEKELGLKSGALGANPVVVDIARPQNLRMPSGNEVGANENWRPGGYTSGGTPEAVIDAAGEGTYTVTPAFQPKP